MAKNAKRAVEILLVRAELTGIPEKGLLKSRNLVAVDLVWPRTGIAKKSAARQVTFARGKYDFTAEEWTKRCLFREEIEGHCGVAVSVTEPVSVQKVRKFLQIAAKYALKQGADFVESAMVGYGDIASAPVDALAQMVGEQVTPKAIAQGVVDYAELPDEGGSVLVAVPLIRPLTKAKIGTVILEVRA